MKLAAPGAGKRREFLRRAALLGCGLTLTGCGGLSARPATPRRSGVWLDPVFGVSGGRLTNRVDPTGGPLPGGNETFITFMFPVAVASVNGELFIADAGYGRLFRYRQAGELIAAVPQVRINATSRLRAGPDGTVYVLDGTLGLIQRYSTLGSSLPPLQPRQPASHYLDFDVDRFTGRVFAVDSLSRLLDRIEPVGRIAAAHLELGAVGPVALDGNRLLTADVQCQCVNEWRNGRLVRKLAIGQIRLPKTLVAEDGEVYVVDGFDRSISRVSDGGLEKLLPAELNLIAPEQIAVVGGTMYVADGASRTVAVFRIRRLRP